MSGRPSVVVYITREHPKTGVDELLLFDVIGDQKYTAVVPGGGIDPGEDALEAGPREAFEETGIHVRVVRDLGVQEGRRRMHFVEAVPEAPTPAEWEHRNPPGPGIESESLVRCYWAAIRPELEVWGERGALLHRLVRRRAVVYATRERSGRTELLTIEQLEEPESGLQVPAGRIGHDEELEAGMWRELAEETGITRGRLVRELPDFECVYETFSRNYAFHVAVEEVTPDRWLHRVDGEGVDAGMTHLCRWVPLSPDLKLWNEGDPMLRHLPIRQP